MGMNWEDNPGSEADTKDGAQHEGMPPQIDESENIFADDSASPADPFFQNPDIPAKDQPAAEPFVSAEPSEGSTDDNGYEPGEDNYDDDFDATGTLYEDPDTPKKNAKWKTYAIIGGAAVFLTGIIGGSLALKKGGSAAVPARPVASLPVAPSEPVPQIAVSALEQERKQFAEESLPQILSNETYPVVEEAPTDPAPTVDLAALQELVESEPLAKLNQLAEHQEMLQSRIESLEEKVSSLTTSNTTIISDIEALKEALKEREQEADKKAQAAAATPVKQVATAKPAPKKPAANKPVARSKPATTIAAPIPKSPLASARVVGVYPANNPTLAYVVTEKGLTAVRPGEFLLGARVLRLDGLTVVTTAGRVRSQ